MFLAHWIRAVANHFQKSPAFDRGEGKTISLGLMRLEDRRVLSVSGGEVMLFSVGGPGASLPDVGQVEAADIVSYDGSQFELFLDGSDVGLSGANIDAFAVAGENQFLLSFASTTTIAGVGTFESRDVLLFQADSLGEDTAGSFSLFLRGTDLGLPSSFEGNIDALDLLEDGTLVFSTAGNVILPLGENGGLTKVLDEDLIQITLDADGNHIAGTMQIYFQGLDAGLGFDSEEIDAVSIDGPQIRFSTLGSFYIESQRIGGSREDVLTYDATSLGENTTGAYVGITFDGSVVTGISFDLNALDFGTFPKNTNDLPTAQDLSVETEEDNSLFVQLLGDDGDEELNQPLTYHIVDSPNFGVITNFDASTGTFTYVPNVNFFGTDHIIYLVQEMDENGVVFTSELAAVTIAVAPINDAPIVRIDQPLFTGDQAAPLVIQGISVHDVEAAAQQTPVLVTLLVENGALSVSDPSSQVQISGNGTSEVQLIGTLADLNLLFSQGVTFLPNPNFSGLTALTVCIEDEIAPEEAMTLSVSSIASVSNATSGSVQIKILAPPITFEERVQELLAGGELKQGDAQFLLNVLRHEGHQVLVNVAIKNIEKWERQGKIDSDMAEELIDWLNSFGEEPSDALGEEPSDVQEPEKDEVSQVDAVFSQIGQGAPSRQVGRFRI